MMKKSNCEITRESLPLTENEFQFRQNDNQNTFGFATLLRSASPTSQARRLRISSLYLKSKQSTSTEFDIFGEVDILTENIRQLN